MIKKFADVGLTASLVETLSTIGFDIPTPVQMQTIPHILAGRDICASAATGTGKTGAYLLPVIDILTHSRNRAGMPRVVILEPTRELASQVMENFKSFATHTNLKAALLVGGEWMNEQEKQLKRKPDIIIATPGRLLDIFERGKLIAHHLGILVVDEADRMLDMGFMPDVERIIKFCPPHHQTILFSATFPPALKGLINSLLTDPKHIEVSQQSKPAVTIKQYKVPVTSADQKREVLRALLRRHPGSSAIVFCNRKKDVDIVAKSLIKHGFLGMPIHGDLAQNLRNETLDKFRTEKGLILVASDVAARGIDIDDLPFVVNFDLPINAEDYIHRIGRTGRAGKEGISYSLVTPRDDKFFKAIKKLIGSDLEELTIDIDPLEPRPVREKPLSRTRMKNVHTDKSENSDSLVGFGPRIPRFMQVDLSKYLTDQTAV